MGNKLSSRMVKFYGQPAKLLDNLAAGGVAPEDVDIVINSHLHFDHCGWNTVRDRNGKIVPTFPRAKYYAPEGEWQYARNPSERDAISYISENYDPLVESGQMTLLKGGEEIVPGISVKTFPGHTMHMQAVMVQSQRRTACYISDLIPTDGAHRPHLGHGIRPISSADHREQEALLRAGSAGKVAHGLHSRREHALGIRGKRRSGENGCKKSVASSSSRKSSTFS